MNQPADIPYDPEPTQRSFGQTFRDTNRSIGSHFRRSSDTQPVSLQFSTLSASRPVSLAEEYQPVLHKVATVEDLHQLKTHRERWNSPEPKFFNRPSDLWTSQEIPLRKQSTAYTLSHQTLANACNDIDYVLREENQRLHTENMELKGQLTSLRNQMAELSSMCETIRQQKERATQQRNDLKLTLERAMSKLSESEKYAEQVKEERNLYYQISDKLRKRVDLLLVENTNMRQALDHLSSNNQQIVKLEEKYEAVREQLTKLQHSIQEDDNDWEVHKHMWIQERQYYYEIIRKLEFQVECLKGRN